MATFVLGCVKQPQYRLEQCWTWLADSNGQKPQVREGDSVQVGASDGSWRLEQPMLRLAEYA